MKRKKLYTGAAACLAIAPGFAWADQSADGDAAAANTVVVSAARVGETPATVLPAQSISPAQLAMRRQGTLGETLAGLPGVHLDNFGAGASRPVIRGQTLPRIEILSDGAAVFDASAVSPDHPITVEPMLLDSIEIVRGPSAVIYGGNAIAAAVNLIDSKVPKAVPKNGAAGSSELRYGSGDDEVTGAARVTAGRGPFAFHVEATGHKANDYAVPSKYGSAKLPSSFHDSSGYSIGGSWITPKGYIGAAYSRQDSEYGLPGHTHEYAVCHLHSLKLHCASHDEPDDHDEHEHEEHESGDAWIKMRSQRFDVRSDHRDLLPGIAHVRTRLSHTDYTHDELDAGEVMSAFANKAYDGRIEFTHVPLAGWTGTFGAQYTNSQFSGTNPYQILHEDGSLTAQQVVHESWNRALFLTESRAFGPVRVEVGARKDWRDMAPSDFDGFLNRVKHNPFSLSAGASWNFAPGYTLALAAARSERAPTVQELYSWGVHLASNTFEYGLSTGATFDSLPNQEQVLETARSFNATLSQGSGPTTFTVGLYHQDFSNYIYADTLDQLEVFRFVHYVARAARFSGIDGELTQRIDPHSSVTLFGDYVRAKVEADNGNLPRIPSARLGVRYERSWDRVTGSVEYYRAFAQRDGASYERDTGAHHMLNLSVAYRFALGGNGSLELFARATNLTNALAFSHASFIKDKSPLRGRNVVFGVRHAF